MTNKPNKSDLKRLANFQKFVKNINPLLKGKSIEQINALFDEQDKILKYISDENLKEDALTTSKKLRDTAISMNENFHWSIDKILNSKELLKWKSLFEINSFFDEIDKDISKIPDMRKRQLIKQQSEYFRWRNCDESLIYSTQATLDKVQLNRKLAWNTIDEVKIFFENLNKDISKISDSSTAWAILTFSNILQADAIQCIELKIK